jgi:hypothetical protein
MTIVSAMEVIMIAIVPTYAKRSRLIPKKRNVSIEPLTRKIIVKFPEKRITKGMKEIN